MSNGLPITHFIHSNNHTQTTRVCNINKKHSVGQSIIKNLYITGDSAEFSNLMPGIYTITINNIKYYFDLYVAVGLNDRLIIKNQYNAYVLILDKHYRINLYKQIATNTTNNLVLSDTVNSYIDMIIIDGKTIQTPYLSNDIGDDYAVIPNNKIIPSSDFQSTQITNIAELEKENTIFYNLDYEYMGPCTDDIDEQYIDSDTSDKSIYNPYIIRSISKFNILSRDETLLSNIDDKLEILLKNNIKSLPNGVKDTFILNAEQCQTHIIYRIGRRVLSGNENWIFKKEQSNDSSWLFWMPYEYVKLENASNNIICSHFKATKASDILSINSDTSTIASGYGDYGNGFFLRIPALAHNEDETDFTLVLKQWLFNQMKLGFPVIIEYPLQNFTYNTVLIDEYHIKTFFPRTYIKINNTYDVSYFYKII